jgi:hypothetical protein
MRRQRRGFIGDVAQFNLINLLRCGHWLTLMVKQNFGHPDFS